MIIQYASDLHLEFPDNKEFLKQNPIQPFGDVLLLAGDIVPFHLLDKHLDFFKVLSKNFKTTYWIPGNHEYYYSDVNEKSGSFIEEIQKNVFLVNNHAVVHDDVKFIFSTLWSQINPGNEWHIERGMSDFRVIKNGDYRFSAPKFNELHQTSANFINQELSENHVNKSVVVTHHVPTLMNYPEEYKTSVLNSAFAVELFDTIETLQPDVWIYGHSHVNTPDFNIGKTRLLTNQLGYVMHGEQKLHSTQKYIKL
ncbi:MAG: metallophosphoesterase [Salinivirgaceae bacterium]|nr:metallophosphoesterase [Salinivirgaceae bacterium]